MKQHELVKGKKYFYHSTNLDKNFIVKYIERNYDGFLFIDIETKRKFRLIEFTVYYCVSELPKINKLFAIYNIFNGSRSFKITTFKSQKKRSLYVDSTGRIFFYESKEKSYITEQSEINRINEFINF